MNSLIFNKKLVVSLIGINPLPAFITILNNYDADTELFLVYTEASQDNFGSKAVAENLKKVIEERINGINITLLKCDKSDNRKINGCINNLFNSIKNRMKKDDRVKLLLDYTSGTKAMSAVFAERVLNVNIEGLTTVISYVDDNQNVILEDSNTVGMSRFVRIRDAVKNLDISIGDVARIHGYKLEKKVKESVDDNGIRYIDSSDSAAFINDNGNRIIVNKVYLLDVKLVLGFESKYINKKESDNKLNKLKMELFEFKDKAEKLGGSRSIIIYKCRCSNKDGETLKKDIRSAYEYEMNRRFSIIPHDQQFVNEVKNIYRDEGGR